MPKEAKQPTTQRENPYPPMETAATASSASRSASTWSSADDDKLMNARASGLNWQPIAAKHFPQKTPNACRKRHERLMERRNAEDWDGMKLETLAQEYMNVRREMWGILAARVGEKWTLVEAKCMEKGLKNLQSAHRSAQRKERDDDRSAGAASTSQQSPEAFQVQRAGLSIQSMLSPTPAHQQVQVQMQMQQPMPTSTSS